MIFSIHLNLLKNHNKTLKQQPLKVTLFPSYKKLTIPLILYQSKKMAKLATKQIQMQELPLIITSGKYTALTNQAARLLKLIMKPKNGSINQVTRRESLPKIFLELEKKRVQRLLLSIASWLELRPSLVICFLGRMLMVVTIIINSIRADHLTSVILILILIMVLSFRWWRL